DTPPVTLPGEAVHSLSDALEDLFSSHPRPSLRIANLERAQKETALDPERNAYYLGLKNRNALSSRTEYEIPAEVVSKRIYPPKAKAARP
ncbi:MAG: hypothetical protein WAT51_05220, partial [Holophaga sp.]